VLPRTLPTSLRELLRQRLRTGLTVAGVALGILVLVVLGSLGEHFRALLVEARGYTRGVVRLFTKTNAQGVNPGITEADLAKVRALPEVALVSPTLVLFLDGFDLEADPMSLATPKPLVEGLAPEHVATLRGGLPLRAGRWLAAGDERRAVVAGWLARRRGLYVGGQVTIRHNAYEVVGLYEAPDAPMLPAAVVPYEVLAGDFIRPQVAQAQRVFGELATASPLAGAFAARAKPELDRLAKRFVEGQEALFRVYEVVPRDRSDEGTRATAASLRAAVPDLAVIDPDRIEAQLEQALRLYLVLTLVVTAVSTVVGGLLVVNTMAMAVLERRREIAIKSAVGATPGQVALEFVLEAGLLGLVGAALGVGLGLLTVAIAEPLLLANLEAGERLFLITPRLVVTALLWGGGLGVLAGGAPAARAARVDPAVVLRSL
jgi:putative ABC transport system permease protein